MTAEIIPLPLEKKPGATREDWQHLDEVLGLTEDLLPVVCNTEADISPNSKLTRGHVGRVPCLYDRERRIIGMPEWTKHISSSAQIQRWAREPDYGTCIVTRLARGLDLDVTNEALVERIVRRVNDNLGLKLPTRRREGTAKRLLVVKIEGNLGKRRLRVANNEFIEFLGTGQMFVAAGSRADGSRYYWQDGAPAEIPTITEDEFNRLWAVLERDFGAAPSVISQPPGEGAADLEVDDPVADYLTEQGLVLSEQARGLVVQCPWEDEHTGGTTGDGATMWLHAGGKGNEIGHFKCMHAHCAGRARSDYLNAIGYQEDHSADFDVIEDTPEEIEEQKARAGRFAIYPIEDFSNRPAPSYYILGVWPRADLIVIFGDSGSGKSFVATDMGLAIARGIDWRGLQTRQGRVVYIVAEGSGGYSQRLKAYGIHHQISLAGIPFYVMPAAPNLLLSDDIKGVVQAINAIGGADIVIFDTLAQVTPGANENSAEDMGLAIANSRAIARAVGGMAVLIHHSGKDATKGARGWSGLRAAADAQLEVVRLENGQRLIQTTKQKDGKDDGRWGFALEGVVVGMDDSGEGISSCVVVEAAAPAGKGGRGPARKKIGQWEQAVMDTFSELQVGGDVLYTELLLRTAEKRPETGTLRDRKKNAGRAIKRMAMGADAVFILGDDYVTEVQ